MVQDTAALLCEVVLCCVTRIHRFFSSDIIWGKCSISEDNYKSKFTKSSNFLTFLHYGDITWNIHSTHTSSWHKKESRKNMPKYNGSFSYFSCWNLRCLLVNSITVLLTYTIFVILIALQVTCSWVYKP